MPDVILVLDSKGHYREIALTKSPRHIKLSAEFLGKTLYDIFPQAQADIFLDHIRRVLTTQQTVTAEYSLSVAGRETWFSTAISPLRKNRVLWVTRDMTEHKRMTREKQESEEQYRILFETNPVGLGVADLNGKLLTFNDAMIHPGGYSRTDILQIGNVANLYFDPAQRERVLALARSQGVVEKYPVKFKRKDGTAYDALLSLTPIQFKGTPAWLAVVEDITDRNRMDAALRTSQAQLAGIIDSAMDAIITIDQRHRITRFNPAAEQMFGYPVAQVIGQPLSLLLPERYRAAHEEVVDRFGETRLTNRTMQNLGTLVGLRSNGEEFPIEISISQTQVSEQKYFTAILRDITERQRAEESLRETHDTLRALIQSSPLAIILLDPHGNVTLWNPASEQMFGWNEAEVQGHLNPIVPPDKMGEYRALRERVLRGDAFTGVEVLRQKKDGSVIPISISTAPLHDSQGNINGILGVMADITERKRDEEELRRRASEFAALYETTRDLAAQLDLPTLLQTIIERAATLLAAPNGAICLYDDVRGDLEIVASQGIEKPIGTRLEIGEGISGRVVLTREPVVVGHHHTWEYRSHKYDDIPFAAGIGVPMLYSGRLIGTLNLIELAGSTHTFSDADVRLLSLFAAQAASAVHNARLLAQTQERAARLAALHEIDIAITSTYDLSQRLDLLLTHTLTHLRGDLATVSLIDPAMEKLQVIAQRGIRHTNLLEETAFKIGEGAAGWVAQHNETLVLFDVQRDPRWKSIDASEKEGIASYLGVPLQVGDKIIGVLDVMTRLPRDFSADERDFLITLAGQAAVAIENARLFDETRHRLVELESVNRISSAMRVAHTLDEMLPQILDETLAVLGADAGIVRLYDTASGALEQSVARGWFSQIEQSPLKSGEGIIGTVFATGKPMVFREFAKDSRVREYMRPQIQSGWGGACVPIRTADAFIGILLVGVRLPRELSADEVHLLTTIANIAGNAIHRTRLHESLEGAYIETVLALAKAMDARDSYTGNHSEDLAKMSRAVAQALGLSRDQEEALLYAARLHDIGKIGVPDAILRKPGSLAADELQLMQQHPVIGAEIIQYVQRLSNTVPIVRHHHEKFDGTGYPDRLAGEAIPLGARILAIVDAFSAMTDDRVYRQGRSRTEAIEEIKRCAGTQFDPRITEIFLTVVTEMR